MWYSSKDSHFFTCVQTASQPDYVEAFIATHSYFIDSQSFMQRLMERFYDDGDEDKIFNVFKKWLTTYCEDFAEEKGILFNMFLSDLSGKGTIYIHLLWHSCFNTLISSLSISEPLTRLAHRWSVPSSRKWTQKSFPWTNQLIWEEEEARRRWRACLGTAKRRWEWRP